jgi:Domain of unknown function (DUF5979)
MKSSLLTSWVLWIFLVVAGMCNARAATLTVYTVVDATPLGVAFSPTERYVITGACFDSTGQSITPTNGTTQTGVPGQSVEFLGIPVNGSCSISMTTKPIPPSGFLLTSDHSSTYGLGVGPSGGRLDLSFRLRAALSVPITLEVVGETVPANATFPFSGYCSGESYRNFSGNIAPGQELRIPDVAANSSCQVSLGSSPTVGAGTFVIATQSSNQYVTSNTDRMVLKLALAGSASLQLNVTTDLVGSTARVTGQADCSAPSSLYPSWNRVNFPFSTGEMALGTSKTLSALPAGLECNLTFPTSIVTGTATLAKPPVYSPAKVITVGAKATTTTATINYQSDLGQLITVNSSYPTGTAPSGVTVTYTFLCQDSAGQYETIRFSGVDLTGTFNSPSRFRSGLVCTQNEIGFSPSAFTSVAWLRNPTLSPSTFTTSATAATVLQIVHRPLPLDATISGKASVSGGALAANTTVSFTPTSCYFEGNYLAFPAANTPVSIPVNAASATFLTRVPSGSLCYFQVSGIPSAPNGTVWLQDNKWPTNFQVTAIAGQNDAVVQRTLVPATAVTFNFLSTGLPPGGQWNLSINSSLTCSINGTTFVPTTNVGVSSANPQATLSLPTGAVCSFNAQGCCSISAPSGYSFRAAPSAVAGIVVSGASQSQNITLQFAKTASIEISAAVTSAITAGAAPPSFYFNLRCDDTSSTRNYNLTTGSTNKVFVYPFDFNPPLTEGAKCSVFGFGGNGLASPSTTSNWFAASESFDITLAGGVNQFAIPIVERRNGSFTHTVNSIAQLSPNSLFFPAVFCTASKANLNQSGPLFGLSNSNAIAPGVLQTSVSLAAGSVCSQQLSPSIGTVPASGYVWTFPRYDPGAAFNIASDAVIAVSATPQVVGDATVTVALTFDSAQYESSLVPSAKLVCELVPGVQRIYAASSVAATPQRQFFVTIPSVPSGASCRVVGVVNDPEKYLNLDVLSPQTTVPAGASTISATLVHRPLQSLSVSLIEQGGVTTSGVFYPSIICSVAGYIPNYIQAPQLNNGVVGPDTRTYTFQNVPETAQCIISLKRFASADATSAFAFAALSQQIKIGSNNNSVTMISRVYPATSIVVSLPATGVPAGSTSVQVTCTAQGAGLENWSGARAAAPVGGSVTVANVPAGATCSVVVAGGDLPRPPAGTQWAQTSFSSGTFVPNAAGTSRVSINLDTVSLVKPIALADHATGHPIPALSWEKLLGLLLLLSGFAYRRIPRKRATVTSRRE